MVCDIRLMTDKHTYGDLKESYCTDAVVKEYQLTDEVFVKILSKMANNKSPGLDKLIAYWLKNLIVLHSHLCPLLQQVINDEIKMPDWLITSMTILLPKSAETHLAKKYRPIACLNTTYKLFTAILNVFPEDNCTSNNVILLEQAGGKKGSWGPVDQLLINKMVMD